MWSLFDPKDVPHLPDLYGEAFDEAYDEAEAEAALRTPGQGARSLRAHDADAGRDRQRLDDLQGRLQPSSATRPACPATSCTSRTSAPRSSRSPRTARLRSATSARINLARHVDATARFDFEKLARNGAHRRAHARPRHRHQLLPDRAGRRRRTAAGGRSASGSWACRTSSSSCGCAFDSAEARALSARIQEEIYFHALAASCELAEKRGPHAAFAETRAAQGEFQFDLWGVTPDGRAALGGAARAHRRASACATRC